MQRDPVQNSRFARLVELEREAAALRSEIGIASAEIRDIPLDPQDPVVWKLLAKFGSDFLSLHGPGGTYLYASPSVSGLFGWDPGDMIGKSAYDFFHPEDLKRIAENHVSHADVDAAAPIEYRFRTADDAWKWVETRSRASKSEDGVETIVCITRDVSERRAIEESREGLLKVLSEKVEQIGWLEGLLPVCAWCDSVRDDDGYWSSVQSYLREKKVRITHAICPECLERESAKVDEAFDDAGTADGEDAPQG